MDTAPTALEHPAGGPAPALWIAHENLDDKVCARLKAMIAERFAREADHEAVGAR